LQIKAVEEGLLPRVGDDAGIRNLAKARPAGAND